MPVALSELGQPIAQLRRRLFPEHLDFGAVFDAARVRPGLFAMMVVSSTEHLDIFRKIHVYLVNNTDTAYPKIKRLTGGFCSMTTI